jgi:hypothetical protein
VEVAIPALGGGAGLVVSVEAVSLDGDPALEPPESAVAVGGVELGGVVVVEVVVVGVDDGVDDVVQVAETIGEVPEVPLEPDGGVPVIELAGVVPAGQVTGEENVGAGPKKATRSVEMLVGSPRVTWATNTRGAAVEALGPSSQTAVPR